MTTDSAAPQLADRLQMQGRLFAELSRMFGSEVPLYGGAVAVNAACNRVAADLLQLRFQGLELPDAQLEETGGERHGAIRIGTAEEYRWIGRFFAVFGMEPHGFYDMTALGAKSQPIIATAFRSAERPEHRMFTSLLQLSYFDDTTRQRIEAQLAQRQVMPQRARELIELSEAQGGLSWQDAEELVQEAVQHIFRWTGEGRDHRLYQDLSKAGFKIAADIACFGTHHLNHLTPNTLCADLYTAAMKFCLQDINADTFRRKASAALKQLLRSTDWQMLGLLFRHLARDQIAEYQVVEVGAAAVEGLLDGLLVRLEQEEQFALHRMPHSGFKDHTEGPPATVPVLLRQDSYKALSETVWFEEEDGSRVASTHTARFGEIEQRLYATTPAGRELYDRCLAAATKAQAAAPDAEASACAYAEAFSSFPITLDELLQQGLVFGYYTPTAAGLAARGSIKDTDVHSLAKAGYVLCEGQRYEDFLPFSAAGIFSSNLGQYGTQCTAAEKPTFTQASLEDVLGRRILDPVAACRQTQRDSLQQALEALAVLDAAAPTVAGG